MVKLFSCGCTVKTHSNLRGMSGRQKIVLNFACPKHTSIKKNNGVRKPLQKLVNLNRSG